VVIEGDAGIGKTQLLRQVIDHVDPSFRVVRATGEEAERQLDYGVLEQLAAEADALGVDVGVAFGRSEWRPDPIIVGGSILEAVRRATDDGPVLVVIDDAQWIDLPSLQAVTFVLRRLRDVPIATFVGIRPPDGALEPLRRLCAAGLGERILLGPLDTADLRALMHERGIALSQRAAQRLHDHTRGRPLEAIMLAEELGAQALTTGFGALPAPRSFLTLVLNRLAGCAPDVERVVSAIAVLAQPASIGRLAKVLDLDPVELTTALDDAIVHGLVVTDIRGGAPVADTAHPLIRSAVLEGMPIGVRCELHRRAATVTVDPTRSMLHRLAGAVDDDPPLAEAAVALAHERLGRGWEQSAIELLIAAAAAFDDDADRVAPLLTAADILLGMGDVESARELLAGLPDDAPVGAFGHFVHGHLALLAGDADAARTSLRAAWDAEPEPAIATRAAGLMATLAANSGRGDRAVQWARRALDVAADGHVDDLGHALTMLASGWALQGDLLAGLEETGRWLVDVEGTPAANDAHLAHGLLSLWTGDLVAADHHVRTVIADAAHESTLTLATARYSLADCCYRSGAWDEALSISRQLASELDDTQQLLPAPMAHAIAAFVLAGRGRWDEAAAHLGLGRRTLASTGNPSGELWIAVGEARLALARHRFDEVVERLTPLAALIEHVALPEGVQPWCADLVEALVGQGRLDQAADALRRVEASAAGGGPHAAAGIARARGQLRAARGDDATAAFEQGLLLDAAATGPFARARLELAAGAAQRRQGHRRAAAELLDAAHVRFTQLGAAPFVALAERELGACGLTRRSSADTPGEGLDKLTRAERAVAELVASGMTNRDVAGELVVSVKTVESHLAKVFAKLDVRTRTELAARWPRS
jgi:DNA-binding CsgD family transcriptional regulator/tetratricopeptide (TPR) repeat protein